MTAKAHQALRDYMTAIRGIIAREDQFGQYLNRLIYRESRISASGLFRQVRGVCEAVIALGGSLAEARGWISQAIRWTRTGKAVEHKYARFEIDSRASGAMDALLKLLQALPDEMLGTSAPGTSPFSAPRPTLPSPPTKPSSGPSTPFGRPFPTPRPNTSPSAPPSAPKPSLFGSRPASPFGSAEPLPFYITICFEAFETPPENNSISSPLKPPSAVPDWLAKAAQNRATEPTPYVPEVLPTTLKGLFELWQRSGSQKTDQILEKIGVLDDLRAIDYLYKLAQRSETPMNLMEIFVKVGGNVGVAGLMTLAPVSNQVRVNWLTALCKVVGNAIDRGPALSEASQEIIWQVARAESSANLPFCAQALNLLAMTGRPEAQAILWTYAQTHDLTRQRIALYALAQTDPGDKLDDLLSALSALPELPAPSTPTAQIAPPTRIGIPFERLEAKLYSSSSKKPYFGGALHLIGYINDPRTVPLLIAQLGRRIPQLREIALSHLRRLPAKEAADDIAHRMIKDEVLRDKAAETLYDWGDARCIPVLLQALPPESMAKPENVIRYLGKLPHAAFDNWLMKVLETLQQANDEDMLVEVIDVLTEIESHNLQMVLTQLAESTLTKVRQAVAVAAGKINEPWATKIIRSLITDSSPLVSYQAALNCKDSDFARLLLATNNEIKQMLGVRLLWAAKDSAKLLDCLAANLPTAVRDLAIWALANLHTPDSLDELSRLIDEEDRLDLWNQNPAVLAWRGLAKVGAVTPTSRTPVASEETIKSVLGKA